MAGNRKAAEQVILKWVGKIDPSGRNTKLLTAFFEKMSDKEFDDYMKAIEAGRDYVSVVAPNLDDCRITTDNNLKVAHEMGVALFQRVWLTNPKTGQVYLSNQRHPVVHLPVRRQIQTLENKISIPEDNKHVDDLTDQPTGVSKGSALSFPEVLALYAQGCEAGIEEMIKYRGGDIKAMRAMDRVIHEQGGVSTKTLEVLGTRAKATQTLSTFLKGMHLDNNA